MATIPWPVNRSQSPKGNCSAAADLGVTVARQFAHHILAPDEGVAPHLAALANKATDVPDVVERNALGVRQREFSHEFSPVARTAMNMPVK